MQDTSLKVNSQYHAQRSPFGKISPIMLPQCLLRTNEISMLVKDFKIASKNDMEAGFDGVDIDTEPMATCLISSGGQCE